jgi:septum formation protein
MPQPIILASASPRRKQLLELAEISFEIIVQHSDEHFPATMQVEEVPEHIAMQKAVAVKQHIASQTQHANKPILAADTIVVLDNSIIGKPKDREDAIAILTALSGREHRVMTGVVILHNEQTIAFTDITKVAFHSLTQEQVIFYIDKYKPYDKAGAYAIHEWIGAIGIQSINGDFYSVMGLPISRVVQALQKL